MTKRWVELIEPVAYDQDECVPAGSVGFIAEVDDHGVLVAFPERYIYPPATLLKPAKLPTVEEAIETIKSHNGHHCHKSNELQFDIKFCHSKAPKIIEEHWLDEKGNWSNEYWDAYNDHLRFQLESYIGESDMGLSSLVPWFFGWHQEGRSAGWLIIKCDYDFMHVIENDLLDFAEEGYYEELEEAEDKIIDLAMWIDYITADIQLAQDELKEEMKTEDFWFVEIEDIMAQLNNEKDDDDDDIQAA